MAKYKLTAPDGRVVTVSGDNPPTQEDAQAIFASLPPAPPAKELGLREKVGTFLNENVPGLEPVARKAKEMLGETSPGEFLMNLPLPRVGALQPFGDVESLTEALPAYGGAAGAVVGQPAAGSGLGELGRQAFRKGVGAPTAPGLIQETLGMDPDSAEASATGLVAEILMGGAGGILEKTVGPLARSAKRSSQNLLKLPEKLRDKEIARGGTKGGELLDRLVDEGIVPPLSSRGSQVARSEAKLAQAAKEADALQATFADEPLREGNVDELLKTLEDALPAERPGGLPKLGRTQMDNAEKALDDATGFISEARGSTKGLTLSKARTEKKRISEEISALFESGADTPLSKKALERSGRAWQKAINESFPELGEAELRRSDLITINKHLKKALRRAEFAGADLSSEGVAVGAAAAGRYSIPAMLLGKAAAVATAGPISSLSGSGKRLLANVLSSPASTQTWLRLMAQLGKEGTEE